MVEVAIYLNVATNLIQEANGYLTYLTGDNSVKIEKTNSRTEETQILEIFSKSIWIANNEDSDTCMQKALLDKLNINDYRDLIEHVDTYGNRILTHHQGNFTYGGMSLKEKLFYNFMTRHGTVARAGALTQIGGSANNPMYNITSATGPPPLDKIVFVRGDYEGSVGNKKHAEQKLLAALGRFLTTYDFTGTILVRGCKSPCETCGKVLAEMSEYFAEHKPGIKFVYSNSIIEEYRKDVGLNVVHASGVSAIKLDKYFPE
nr:hypothetical protein [uncultured Sphaerochaeta sp.]